MAAYGPDWPAAHVAHGFERDARTGSRAVATGGGDGRPAYRCFIAMGSWRRWTMPDADLAWADGNRAVRAAGQEVHLRRAAPLPTHPAGAARHDPVAGGLQRPGSRHPG